MTCQPPELTERDIKKIVKILQLSTSEVETEAMAALRMSQRILKKHGSNFEMLFEKIRADAKGDIQQQVSRLQQLVKQQSSELSNLRNKPNAGPVNLTEEQIFSPPRKVTGTIYHLKNFLLNRLSLLKHERAILEKIETIPPKSREEYLVLICARRHKITFQPV